MVQLQVINGQLRQRVDAPIDDGLDAVRAYMSGGVLDATTEVKVKSILANVVPPKSVISTTLDFTYYPKQPDGTEPVDVITVTKTNTVTSQVVSVKQIKHYLDGTQPHEI